MGGQRLIMICRKRPICHQPRKTLEDCQAKGTRHSVRLLNIGNSFINSCDMSLDRRPRNSTGSVTSMLLGVPVSGVYCKCRTLIWPAYCSDATMAEKYFSVNSHPSYARDFFCAKRLYQSKGNRDDSDDSDVRQAHGVEERVEYKRTQGRKKRCHFKAIPREAVVKMVTEWMSISLLLKTYKKIADILDCQLSLLILHLQHLLWALS
jgi:hypothetical protein